MNFRLFLLSAASVANAKMVCPPTAAWGPAAGMKLTTTVTASCDKVLAEMKARVAGQYGAWHDPHNNGTYAVKDYGGTFSTSRLTGNKKYTDKQIFTLTDSGSSCKIEACSRSQVTSVLDMGTNYCDLKMLFCGSADGCKPVVNDFSAGPESTEKYASASVDLGACLKAAKEATVVEQPAAIMPKAKALASLAVKPEYASQLTLKAEDAPCCKTCTEPLEKYYSVDVPHGFCGEACMDPKKFWIYKIFEANLTKSTDDAPCSEQFTPHGGHYTKYYQTVTHGLPGVLAVTLDLYAPVDP